MLARGRSMNRRTRCKLAALARTRCDVIRFPGRSDKGVEVKWRPAAPYEGARRRFVSTGECQGDRNDPMQSALDRI
jgi:hypothetical protein